PLLPRLHFRLALHLLARPERRPRQGLRRRQEFVPLRRRGRSEASRAHVFDSTAQRLNGSTTQFTQPDMKYSTVSTAPSLIWLVSLTALATASGETATSRLNPKDHVEKYDMPPAYIYRLEPSPRTVSTCCGLIMFQAPFVC